MDILEHILDGREEPTDIPFELLKNITGNFSEEQQIGQGGFATVYKGVLPNGNVAVKRIMSHRTFDESLFHGEVNHLLKVNHQNVVRFLGYCANTEQTALKPNGATEYIYAEKRERLFCFEFISNGTLQKHITDELRGLEWNTRYEIIMGICKGLHYLHTEKHIIHMDLKPDNILLDNHMVPKITDFGLSRSDEKSHTMREERCVSLGYCAPEYLLGGRMSVQSDIYSLGVIIIELITGCKGIPDNRNVLRRWRHRWNKLRMETPLDYVQVTKCLEIGLLCMDHEPYKRPLISHIIRDMSELEVNNCQNSRANESTIGEICPYSEDDMLGIEPLELYYRFERNKKVSSSLQLINETDAYVAFQFLNMSPLPYCTQPNEGIVPPRSNCVVHITLQLQDKRPKDLKHPGEFTVRSTKVNDGFAAADIKAVMLNKEARILIDEVNVDVVFDTQTHSDFLDIHPPELQFLFKPNKESWCSLHLTNNTDGHVAFMLINKSDERISEKTENRSDGEMCFVKLPLYDIVSPRSTYTLMLKTDARANLPKARDTNLIMQNYMAEEEPNYTDEFDRKKYFQKARELANSVHKVTLKAIYVLKRGTVNPTIKSTVFPDRYLSGAQIRDANLTEAWILVVNIDGFHKWRCDGQLKVERLTGMNQTSPGPAKCIPRKQWIVTGTYEGLIRVYNSETKKKIKHFNITGFLLGRILGTANCICFHCPFMCECYRTSTFVMSLSVHATHPYMLALLYSGRIKLLDWDKGWFGWKCKRTFKHSDAKVVAFNPKDPNGFVSASREIKIWTLDSRTPRYTFSGHADGVWGLQFFIRDDRQYLITTGNRDNTAKIWDMQDRTCVHTLAALHVSIVHHPNLPIIVTYTKGGIIQLLSSTDFRLKRNINISALGYLDGLICLEPRSTHPSSIRIGIAHSGTLSVIDIHDEEQVANKGNNGNSTEQTD